MIFDESIEDIARYISKGSKLNMQIPINDLHKERIVTLNAIDSENRVLKGFTFTGIDAAKAEFFFNRYIKSLK